jgi:F-box interacting protein
VNGTIDWLVSKMYPTKNQHVIASFDLRNESYQELLLPDCGAVDVYNLSLGALGVLSNCLCMVFRHHVWVMKEYGNKNSWTKLFAINYMPDLPKSYATIKVLNIF